MCSSDLFDLNYFCFLGTFQCEPGLGAAAMYHLLYNSPTKMMLLAGCSTVCTTVAEAAKMWNLVVVSYSSCSLPAVLQLHFDLLEVEVPLYWCMLPAPPSLVSPCLIANSPVLFWFPAQLCYGASSPALSNRNRFQTLFRTHPNAIVHNPTRVYLMKKYNWTRIAILQEAEEVFITVIKIYCSNDIIVIRNRVRCALHVYFEWPGPGPFSRSRSLISNDNDDECSSTELIPVQFKLNFLCLCSLRLQTVEDLEERCKQAGIEIVTRQSFLTKPAEAVRNIERQDARIIIGFFYVQAARQVLCEIYNRKLYGKRYVWFFIGWYENNWYEVGLEKEGITCTAEQMRIAAEGHLTTEALMWNQDNTEVTVSGMVINSFLAFRL